MPKFTRAVGTIDCETLNVCGFGFKATVRFPQRSAGRTMRIVKHIWQLRIWRDERGQDLIEYALMAGFVAVAAGAIMPGVATSISTIFSEVSSSLNNASTQGS